MQPFSEWNQQFVAPNAQTMQLDPGYQFRMQEGQKALERSASARGTLNTGGTMKAAQAYGQGLASQEYGNVYNRAIGEYQQAYNIFENNQAGRFNRLASLAGMGQTAAGQLNSAAGAYGANAGNLMMGQGNALAAGQVGAANAWNEGLGNAANTAMDMYGMWAANRQPASSSYLSNFSLAQPLQGTRSQPLPGGNQWPGGFTGWAT